MPAISRRSIRAAISKTAVLAAADDLNGTSDNTQAFDVTSGDRLIIAQINNGANGALGIDVVEYSEDGGKTWAAATDLLAFGSDDATGTVVAGGILNVAGTEPTGAAFWKAGPFEGPTAVRVTRNVTYNAASVAWTTGAPQVICVLVGGTTGDLTALA